VMGNLFCCAKNEDELKLTTINYVTHHLFLTVLTIDSNV
jgi:hypothetical protein